MKRTESAAERTCLSGNARGNFGRRMRSGFTLIEIVAALVILAVLMAMIYTSLTSILVTHDELSQEVAIHHAGTTLLSVLNADLRAFFFYNYDFAHFALYNEAGEGAPGSYLSFSVLNYRLDDEATSYDLVGKVTYKLVEDGAFVRAFEPVVDYAGALVPTEQLLYSGVASFVVQCRDVEEWLDEWTWDVEEPAVPGTITVQLALVPEDDFGVEPVVFAETFKPTTYACAGKEDNTRPILAPRRRAEQPERQGTSGGRPVGPGQPPVYPDGRRRGPGRRRDGGPSWLPDRSRSSGAGGVPQPPPWPEGMP